MYELVCDLKNECANCTSLDHCTPERIRGHTIMVKKNKIKKKPVQIYFRSPSSTDVTKVDPNVVADYNKILPVDVITCDSWDELDILLNQKPNQLSIHANVFALTDISCISETIKMLQKKLKILRLDIPIAIVVEKITPRNIVGKAKEAGIQGLIPYHGDWDSVDIMQGLDALTNRIQHWPEHIINQLPISKPLHVVFLKDWKLYLNTGVVDAIKKKYGVRSKIL